MIATKNVLPLYFMNGAGWAKNKNQVLRLARLRWITHIMLGSFTILSRPGTTGGANFVRLWDGSFVNALSLPNGGIEFLLREGPEMVRIAKDAGKDVGVSGAWLVPPEAGRLAAAAFEIGADMYEDNKGCPNVFTDGKAKAIPSYRLDLMREADEHIVTAVGVNMRILDKLSAYADPEERERVAHYLAVERTQTARRGVVNCNTLAGARPLGPDGKPLITAIGTNGFGGLSGLGLRQLALTNAAHFRQLLPDSIEVFGAGGITDGDSLEAYRLAGCCGGQVAGAGFWEDNIEKLDEIAEDWIAKYAQAA